MKCFKWNIVKGCEIKIRKTSSIFRIFQFSINFANISKTPSDQGLSFSPRPPHGFSPTKCSWTSIFQQIFFECFTVNFFICIALIFALRLYDKYTDEHLHLHYFHHLFLIESICTQVLYEMMCGRLPFYSRDHEVLFEMILTDDVQFPKHVTRSACSLLAGLLEKDPSRRLGASAQDARELMAHVFFADIDWLALLEKRILVPWKPDVQDDFDTKYIPEEFSKESVDLTPPGKDCSLTDEDQENFHNFSFSGSRSSLESLNRKFAKMNSKEQPETEKQGKKKESKKEGASSNRKFSF